MEKKFKVKPKYGLTYRFLRMILRIVKRKPKFINLNEGEKTGKDLPKKCIIIGNHSGASGPINYRAFLKNRYMNWGAHEMCEGFISRKRYLYHVFYRQKLGYSKFRAFIMSYVFGWVSRWIYDLAGVIPTYQGPKLRKTFKYSLECLQKNISVMIFPEDSNDGYKEHIERLWPGFLHLAKMYFTRYNEDLPIYTLYYSKEPKVITIGKPMYLQELLKEHTQEEILKIFLDYMNSLGGISKK